MERYDDGENPGVCTACEHIQDGCEPDAERYACENCGAEAVNGIDILLMEN